MTQRPDSNRNFLRLIINDILNKKGDKKPVDFLDDGMSLTRDIGLDSLDLAEITVRLEDEYGIDIFEQDIINNVGEILQKLDS